MATRAENNAALEESKAMTKEAYKPVGKTTYKAVKPAA